MHCSAVYLLQQTVQTRLKNRISTIAVVLWNSRHHYGSVPYAGPAVRTVAAGPSSSVLAAAIISIHCLSTAKTGIWILVHQVSSPSQPGSECAVIVVILHRSLDYGSCLLP